MDSNNVDPAQKKTIENIPRDDATRKKIASIIDEQFDIEIYLKQRELATIKREIERAESALGDIKTAVKNESLAASMPEAAHYTRRSAAYLHGNPTPTTLPKRKTYRTADRNQLYGRRQDGVYVSLACPACRRDDFANQQGFLNHCRISHGLEFGPYEQIMLQCGTPVDEAEVPLDNPARLRPVLNLTSVSRALQKKKERPTIKEYEEEIDMDIGTDQSQKPQRIPTIAESYVLPDNNQQEDNRTEASKSLPENQPSSNNSSSNSNSNNDDDNNNSNNNTNTDTNGDTNGDDDTKVESIAAALSVPEIGSRFYIKRRIIVGNVSKFISPDRRDPTLKKFTHKWMVYVSEPPSTTGENTNFITCVRFHIHPSYKPHDVVDVTEPPFKLTRLGWGEFPIRIQLFFVDKKRNKSIDIIHHLKLDDTHSGKQTIGSERSVEIELDRNTDFKDTSSIPTTIVPEIPQVATKQKMQFLNSMLREHVQKLPIVTTASGLPYHGAPSATAFFAWSVGKQKALEWHRAHLLRLKVQQQAYNTMDTVLKTAADAMSTKDVVLWCRTYHYTPNKQDVKEEDESMEKAQEEVNQTVAGYCKFCGGKRNKPQHTTDDHCPTRPKDWNSRKRNAGLNSTTSVNRLLDKLEEGWDEVKESDEMDIEVDEDETLPVTSTEEKSKIDDLLQRVKDFSIQDNMDVANERSIDWIWSVVGQLRLKSVIANDMLLAKDGNLQGPTSNFDLEAAMGQRLMVGNILHQVTKSFLRRLVNETVNICHEQGKEERMMVPFHVYQAANKAEQFDFLTNQFMGPEQDEDSN